MLLLVLIAAIGGGGSDVAIGLAAIGAVTTTGTSGVLAVDQGELDTELTFSCNIRSTTTSINDYIYSTPAVQAKDNGFCKSQLVL